MRSTVTWPRGALVFTLSAVFAGCSAYTQTTLDEVAPGSTVRLEVESAGAARAEEFTRSREGRLLEGSVLGVSRDSVVLSMWRTDLASSGSFRAGTIRVPLDIADVVDVSARRISVVRTGLLVSVLAGAAYVIIEGAFGGSTGGAGDGSGGGPGITLIPLRVGS